MSEIKAIRIKYDGEKYFILARRDREDTRQVAERRQCSSCKHMRKAVTVKESLCDGDGNKPEPVGVCTLGIVWGVITEKPEKERLNCSRLSMGLKDSYDNKT